MSKNYFVVATFFAKSSIKSVSTKTIIVFNFIKFRFVSLKRFMIDSNLMVCRAFCIIRTVVHYMPEKNLFSGFNFPLASLLVCSLVLPLIELYEYLEFGVVYKLEGDFVPRFCRFVKVFWHYDTRLPQAQDGQNQEQSEPGLFNALYRTSTIAGSRVLRERRRSGPGRWSRFGLSSGYCKRSCGFWRRRRGFCEYVRRPRTM